MSDTKAKKTNRRFKFKLPHVYTIMFLLIVVFAVLTWIGSLWSVSAQDDFNSGGRA